MKKHKQLLLIGKIFTIIIIVVSIFALVLLCSLKHFSDYRPNTIELMIICMLFSLFARFLIDHYYKEQAKYKVEVKKLDSVDKDINSIIKHVSNDVSDTNNNHS